MEDDNTERSRISPLLSGWRMVMNVCSVIGLVGIIEDLRSWKALGQWVMKSLGKLAPAIADGLKAIGDLLHQLLETYRSLTRPVFDFLFQWLPFEIPEFVIDILVVATFFALGKLRNWLYYHKEWKAADEIEIQKLIEEAKAFGVTVNSDAQNEMATDSASVLRIALSAYSLSHSKFLSEEKKAYWRQRWDEYRKLFGPELDRFAAAKTESPPLSKDKHNVFDREDRANFWLYAIVVVVALWLLLDFWLFV